MKRFIGLLTLIGLSWALAAPASADTRVQVNLNTPGLQLAGYNNNRSRRSLRNRGFTTRSFNNRRFNNRGFNNRSILSLNLSNRGYYSGNRGYSNSLSNGYSGSSCQRVSKRGYWHDRPALIGGRECIDRDGYAYIVPNSRHLIRYY